MYVRACTHTETLLPAFHDNTLDYSELWCSAARAQSTPRRLGSRKQYKIDMHAPLCLSEVCGAWMPGGAAPLTQASLPRCNTGSLIRCNKRGNEVRQQGETQGKAAERQGWSLPVSTQRTMSYLTKNISEQPGSMETNNNNDDNNDNNNKDQSSVNGYIRKEIAQKVNNESDRRAFLCKRLCVLQQSNTDWLTEGLMVCGKDLPQPFTLPCSSLSHPGSRVLHGTSTSHCPDRASLPCCLSTPPPLHLRRERDWPC